MKHILLVILSLCCNQFFGQNPCDALQCDITHNDSTCGLSNGSATASVTGGQPPYSYIWSNAETTELIENLANGTYIFTVTDNLGCSSTCSITIEGIGAPMCAVTGRNTSCGINNGMAEVFITGGEEPYNINWSTGESTNEITGLSPNSYVVTVTDANNCLAICSIDIEESSNPTCEIITTASSCGGCNGTATAFANGGTGPYIYNWFNGAVGKTISGLCPGETGCYVTDARGCTTYCTATVEIDDTFICKDEVTVYLDLLDTVEIIPSMLLEVQNCDLENIWVEVLDAINGNALPESPFVNGNHLGLELVATLNDGVTGRLCASRLIVKPCEKYINLNLVQLRSDDEIFIDIIVEDFIQIVGFDLNLVFDNDFVELIDVVSFHENLPSSFYYYSLNDSVVTFKLRDIAQATTIPDGETLVQLKINLLKDGVSDIYIEDNPAIQEFSNFSEHALCFVAQPRTKISSETNVYGHIFKDYDANCAFNSGVDFPAENWIVKLTDNTYDFFSSTDQEGAYTIFAPPGEYLLTAINKHNIWEYCENSFQVEIVDNSSLVEQDFFAKPNEDCSIMSVNMFAPFLRRCAINRIFVEYSNEGNTTATNAFIDVELDDLMEFESTSHSDFEILGSIIRFHLDDIKKGEYGRIYIDVSINCEESILGQTHCMEARIYPYEPCIDPDPAWTGASIKLESNCENDEVIFQISNVGNGDMAAALEYTIIEDDRKHTPVPFYLTTQDSIQIKFPANGVTYRILAEQEPFHPGMSNPTIAVEGCVSDSEPNLDFSTGFVTMFPEDDLDPNLDIFCMQNRGSYDPNDKQAFPRGYGDEALIEPNTRLEYKIRFQNTGTDTAFIVIVKDSIREELDIATISFGASSHDYDFSIENGNTLVFKFENILLVDSTTNEPESHGFLTFSIDHHKDLAVGTTISNNADIYFDFNDPITTNYYTHKIATNFVELVSTNTIFLDKSILVYPNPSSDFIYVDYVSEEGLNFEIFNLEGRKIKETPIRPGERIMLLDLPPGNYAYRIIVASRLVERGILSKI